MKISIRSTRVLSLLALLSLGLMMWVEFSTREVRTPHYDEKLAAAKHMQEAMRYLKEKHFGNEVNLDQLNDPNDTRLVGSQFSLITSGRGSLPAKLSCMNPNLAALVVDMFHDAGINQGDLIGVCATGSFPALNIAVASAAETMQLDLCWINSLTSSSWGANDPEFTYLDIHASLVEGAYLSNAIQAASIGGNKDLGRTLSAEGRSLAKEAIKRNGCKAIMGADLQENIDTRIHIMQNYAEQKRKDIKAFINIGGGIASLGSNANADILNSGLLSKLKIRDFTDKQGVCYQMAVQDIPVINLHNITKILNRYSMPIDPVPLPEVGAGELFFTEKYDYRLVLSSLILLLGLVVAIILYDKKQNALGNFLIKTENEEK